MKQADASTLATRGRSPFRRAAARSVARGLSLIEVLFTLAVISILAALLIPQMGQEIPDQLSAVSEIVAADLEYARSLAVVNNSRYQITFDLAEQRYVLRHSGANTLLHVLPDSAFRLTSDPPDAQTTDLADLPIAQPIVELLSVVTTSGTMTAITDVEFTELGGTARNTPTVLWLSCGSGTIERFVSITINPATGLVEIGPLTKTLPTAVANLVAASALPD
jgi:prepilin-type N-terminal cleavage/methylation domain-containing protein